MTEQYHTQEGETITRQTGKVEFAFIKRTSDGQYQYSADVGKNGFTTEKAATFLNGVYASAAEAALRIGAMMYEVEAPVKAATPQSTHDGGDGYTAAIAWTPTAATFAGATVYKATVTYTAKAGYVFDGGLVATDVIGAPEGAIVTRVSATVVKVAATYPATGA